MEYDLQTQAKFAPAIAVLYNFILLNDPDDLEDNNVEGSSEEEKSVDYATSSHTGDSEPYVLNEADLGRSISAAERKQAGDKRDHIANNM